MSASPAFGEALFEDAKRRPSDRPLPIAAAAGATPLICRSDAEPGRSRRAKLWELPGSLHCSVIGTCLSTRKLRAIILRFGVVGGEGLDEHGLHRTAVRACCRQSDFARSLHSALDKRHRTALNRFARQKSAAELQRTWEEAVAAGDIPGAYWATLTHPAATDKIIADAFGAVHMLSHLVGAANRADIRRLRDLEREREQLAAKVERQQHLLREGFIERDRRIRALTEELARRIAAEHPPAARADATPGLIADLERRLSLETARCANTEQRLVETEKVRSRIAVALARKEQEAAALRAELQAIEAGLARGQRANSETVVEMQLEGLSLLYVGGRANQVRHIRVAAERAGAEFLHHDGGVEDREGRLPGLVHRADAVLFPVDCVSHTAALTLKRLCRQAGRRWIPLRNASLTCFLAAATDVPLGQAAGTATRRL